MPRKLVPQRYVVGSFASPPSAETTTAWRNIAADDALRQPLDLPAVLLSEYFRERGRSRLGRLLDTANRLALTCETVVLVGPKHSTAGAAALLEAAAHPFYNRLSHGGRGGRPRVVFVEPTLDNDLLQAALDLLKSTDEAHVPGNRWGLVVEQPSPDACPEQRDELVALKDVCLKALYEGATLKDEAASRLAFLSHSLEQGLPIFAETTFFGGLSLVTAALVGADVVAMFKGAAWFLEAAKKATPAECEAVRLAGFLAHGPAQLVAWHHALEGVTGRFASDAEVLTGFDPTTQRRMRQETHRRRVHLFTDVVRRDRLATPSPLLTAYQEVRDAETAAGADVCEIRLARLNEQALGELCAWFEAAKLIERHA